MVSAPSFAGETSLEVRGCERTSLDIYDLVQENVCVIVVERETRDVREMTRDDHAYHVTYHMEEIHSGGEGPHDPGVAELVYGASGEERWSKGTYPYYGEGEETVGTLLAENESIFEDQIDDLVRSADHAVATCVHILVVVVSEDACDLQRRQVGEMEWWVEDETLIDDVPSSLSVSL